MSTHCCARQAPEAAAPTPAGPQSRQRFAAELAAASPAAVAALADAYGGLADDWGDATFLPVDEFAWKRDMALAELRRREPLAPPAVPEERTR